MELMDRARAWVMKATNCQGDEVKPLCLTYLGFGMVLASYFLLVPLRDDAGVTLGTATLPVLFVASLALTLVAAPSASALFQWHSHKGRALHILYRIMAAVTVGFFAAYLATGSPVPGPPGAKGLALTAAQRAVRCAFYLWVSLMNLVAVASYWTRTSDVFTPEASTRLFGIVGAGATTGQLLASLTAAAVTRLPVFAVGGVSLVPMLLAVLCLEVAGQASSRVGLTPAAEELAKRSQQRQGAQAELNDAPAQGIPSPVQSLKMGASMILASSYLQKICVFVVVNYFVSSFYYFERTLIFSKVPDAAARTTWFALINSASAAVILCLQLSVTGRALRALGVRAALCTTPGVATLCMLGLAAAASPETIAGAEVTRKVLTYALARPAREVLFTVLPRDQKYGAKVFLDTVVQRVGDVSAAAVFATLVPGLGLGPRALPLAAAPVCLAWAAAAYSLGGQFQAAAAAAVRGAKSSGDAAEQGGCFAGVWAETEPAEAGAGDVGGADERRDQERIPLLPRPAAAQ